MGEWITYDVRYRLTYTDARDEWEHKTKPSPRETSWHGVASLYERAYLVFGWKPIVLYWGRDYEDWGPNDDGESHRVEDGGQLRQAGREAIASEACV